LPADHKTGANGTVLAFHRREDSMDPAVATGTPNPSITFHDGLGERRRISDPTGSDTLERLCLSGELTAVPSFEFALRERASRLAGFRHTYYARVRSVDRLNDPPAALALVSESVRGVRLSTLLAASERPTIDINSALHLLRQLVSAAAMLHETARDIAHGALGPERIIVTPNARVVITEYVLGAALEQLRYSRDRYWTELRIALPPSSGVPRFDQRADAMQIGVVALSLILGRLLKADEYPARLRELVASTDAISAHGGFEPLPLGFRAWLARALQIDPDHSFASALDARAELDRVLAAEDEEDYEPVLPAPALEATHQPLAPEPVHVETPQEIVQRSTTPEPAAAAQASVSAADPEPAVTRPVVHERAESPIPRSVAPRIQARVEPRIQDQVRPRIQEDHVEPRIHEPVPSRILDDRPKPHVHERVEAPSRDHLETEAWALAADPPQPVWRRWLVPSLAAALIVGSVGATFGARRYFAPRPVATSTGTLAINTNPAGAQVFVDGTPRGVTPLSLPLNPGSHSLELRGDGEPRTMAISIAPGQQLSHYVDLPKGPATFGQLQIRTEPGGAQVSVDGVPRGKAPVLVEALAPGEHAVVLESDLGTVRQSVNVEAGVTASLVVPLSAGDAPVSGWIAVTAPVELQLYENKRLIGSSQSDRLLMTAGRHEIEIINEPLGYRAVRTVQVQPGKVSPISMNWPTGTIAINAQPWADVWIDGEKVGETPIGNLSLPIGPHEIVFRNPDLGEQHEAVTVTLKAPSRVSVDLRKKP
jgi:hypothetical protein